MNIENKFKLIQKLYGKKTDWNYFFNPNFSLSELNMNQLIKKWENFYEDNPECLTQLYIHTPFCLEKCKYCQYHSGFKIEDSNTLPKYIDYLENYIKKSSHIFEKIDIGGFSFGGGTPSIYSQKDLDRLLSIVTNNFKFRGDYYKEFELHPISTTFSKLDILKKYSIDRITLGIQSFNKKTLEKESRTYCSPERLKKIIDYARNIGIGLINVDLILGLNDEKQDEVSDSLEKMLYCKPDTIQLYTIQHKRETSCLFDGEDLFFERVKQIHKYLIDNLISNSDYEIIDYDLNVGIILGLKGRKKIDKKQYNSHLNGKQCVFGVGFGAYSKIYGVGKYFLPDYQYIVDNFRIKFEKLTLEDEKNIFLTRFIQDGYIDLKFLYDEFGVNILIDYKEEIDFLLKNEKIQIKKNKIIFVTKNVKESYLYGLILLDLKYILKSSLYMK